MLDMIYITCFCLFFSHESLKKLHVGHDIYHMFMSFFSQESRKKLHVGHDIYHMVLSFFFTRFT